MTYEDIDNNLYDNILKPFGTWLSLPFKTEYFDFGQHSNYTQQGIEPMKLIHKSVSVNRLAEEFIFYDRAIFGIFQIFETKGAKVKLTKKII